MGSSINALFGADLASTWTLFRLNSVQTLGPLGIIWILFIAIIGSKGLDKISKITSIGGTAVDLLNIAQVMITSPSADYQSMAGIFSFMTFAIFVCGIFTNWNEILNSKNVHSGNVAYRLMKNLGYQIEIGFGAFFTLTYSPLKTLMQGAHKKYGQEN